MIAKMAGLLSMGLIILIGLVIFNTVSDSVNVSNVVLDLFGLVLVAGFLIAIVGGSVVFLKSRQPAPKNYY